jgi:hypothetical protein
MRKRTSVIVALVVLGAVVVGTVATIGVAQSGGSRFTAQRMSADFEVPVVSSDARGSFEARLVNPTTVNYTLRWSGLDSEVRQAHIHFAQTFASGGIVVWLCETASNPAPSPDSTPPFPVDLRPLTPECPTTNPGEVTDSFTASEVVGGNQGIAREEFGALLEAMRDRLTYANVHSALIPAGEIRGQIRRGGGGDDDDDD